MNPTQQLHDLGQNLWLDNITRGLLTSEMLRHYIDELPITGLTSNPSIFDHAIKNSNFYDDAIHQKMKQVRRVRLSSSSLQSRTSGRPPICSDRSTTGQTALTVGVD